MAAHMLLNFNHPDGSTCYNILVKFASPDGSTYWGHKYYNNLVTLTIQIAA